VKKIQGSDTELWCNIWPNPIYCSGKLSYIYCSSKR